MPAPPTLLSWTLNRLGFDVGFIVEASLAGTPAGERTRWLRIRRAGFMRLLQVAVVVPTLREISDPPLRVSTGLDEHPARRWTSWHRLGQCDHARPRLVVVTIATQRRTHTTHATLIALTVNELRRLFDGPRTTLPRHRRPMLAWSRWLRPPLGRPVNRNVAASDRHLRK